MSTIKKKTWPDMFEAIASGRKKFDLRVADFDAKEGDVLVLEEYDPNSKQYTGRKIEKKITYVLKFETQNYPFASPADVAEHGLQIFSLE